MSETRFLIAFIQMGKTNFLSLQLTSHYPFQGKHCIAFAHLAAWSPTLGL